MKKVLALLFYLTLNFCFSQKVELKKVTDSSQIFKGEIAESPITMQLNFDGIIDCHQYQHFVEGWYYYDKYRKKIPLSGVYNLGDLYLFNFGEQQKKATKTFKEKMTRDLIEKSDSIAKTLRAKEILSFSGQDYDKKISGNFYMGNKTLPAELFTKDSRIYRYNNYLILPKNKKINTYDFINPLGGNELISYASDQSGNRVLLYFEELSNFNFCGMCGASDGEKGYRVLYFTNDWNFKKYDDFLIESCLENIYDTKMTKSKDSKTLKFNIQKTTTSPSYTLIVDVKNASVTKSK
ncbi:MAG: hypothetical protein DI622_04035 [Chryseobacterium sp.]|uniref:hypothetical protein n=1 Tax=Chryseobacterium sp. TaxID=1871047 RepID=UPI000DB5397F|nr:hypothetical protein [Chryseobacterium sp.]MPS64086.1 hypothetical protein [Chryseobacterium sp.]PZU24388.1 MAG: hypothetical protein DI622_04035 [Chryseobacterium sp.]